MSDCNFDEIYYAFMSANAAMKHVWFLQADQVPYAYIRKVRSYVEPFLRISNETKLKFRAPHTM